MSRRISVKEFVEDQKACFDEAMRHWNNLLKKRLPACDDTYEDHEYGSMVWNRGKRCIRLTLSTSMQWLIHVDTGVQYAIRDSSDEPLVYDAGEEDIECVGRLKELLKA